MSFVFIDVTEDGELVEHLAGDSIPHPSLDPTATLAQSTAVIRRRRSRLFRQRHNQLTTGVFGALPEESNSFFSGMRELTLDDVVIPAQFSASGDAEQSRSKMHEVATAFNRGISKHVIVGASTRKGLRVSPGYYLVAHRNHRCEVAVGEGKRLILRVQTGFTQAGLVGKGIFHHNSPIIGGYGSYIVNIPQGKYGMAWSGHHPILLADGIHVIHDATFCLDDPDANTSVTPREISGSGNPESTSPWLIGQDEAYISHSDIHIVRVPQGKIAKIIVDSRPKFLGHKAEAYVFETPQLTFEGFADAAAPYIRCGTLHRIIIPGGHIAKVWMGSNPVLLEPREDPYLIDDPEFRVTPPISRGKSSPEEQSMVKLTLVPTLSRVIRHGHLVKVRPGVDGSREVAVIRLVDGTFKFSDSPTSVYDPDVFVGFLPDTIQVMTFPSKSQKFDFLAASAGAGQSTMFDSLVPVNTEVPTYIVRTMDSLSVAVRLLVAFQVSDRERLVHSIPLDTVPAFVESLALSDLSSVVQRCTSQNYISAIVGSSTTTHSLWKVFEKHLQECGLSLIRIGVERATVLDEFVYKQMSRQAMRTATLVTEHAVIDQRMQVLGNDMELEKIKKLTEAECTNHGIVAAANSSLVAARLEGEMIIEQAKAEAAAMAAMGKVLREHPELLQAEMSKILGEAVAEWGTVFVSPSGCTASSGEESFTHNLTMELSNMMSSHLAGVTPFDVTQVIDFGEIDRQALEHDYFVSSTCASCWSGTDDAEVETFDPGDSDSASSLHSTLDHNSNTRAAPCLSTENSSSNAEPLGLTTDGLKEFLKVFDYHPTPVLNRESQVAKSVSAQPAASVRPPTESRSTQRGRPPHTVITGMHSQLRQMGFTDGAQVQQALEAAQWDISAAAVALSQQKGSSASSAGASRGRNHGSITHVGKQSPSIHPSRQKTTTSGGTSRGSNVVTLLEMGFTNTGDIVRALAASGDDVEQALRILLSSSTKN